jgi:hypothetical protein
VNRSLAHYHKCRHPGTPAPPRTTRLRCRVIERVGSFHADEHVTFAVCHGHKPGIVIDLADSKYDSVVLTIENPDEIVARLSAPQG